ncbi:hypothetical protein BKA82DRAFT_180682 [Pisolithus tinctorius]|uniref:Uncharacterized protein n=1 Tax=Pisolithus tinctorius Marx 270 TaxID=870435 RepID=A0A0C3JZS7_PISTI|nr:hypothetical protein BKA82DRAFT_180682 [Pisolithus tinctorius]KIO14658.1 hypothetical protein M404DRAFT_180682 [Pisolithus tinctorius Marx 270]
MSVIQTPRPSKRLKQRDDDDTHLVPPIAVKSEPSSPSLPIGRRLVTSGVKRFFPLPQNCQPSCPQYKFNRKQWAASCIKELEVLALRVERTMIRDDGLVIDWSSSVPVWTDTMKPNTYDLASAITQTYEANARARPRTGKHPSLSSHLTRPPAIPHNSIDTSPSKRDGNRMSSSSIPRLLLGLSMPDSTKSDVKNSPREKLPVPPRPSSICRTFSTQTNGPTKSTPTHGPPQRPRSPTRSDDLDGSFPSKRKRSPAPSVFSSSTTDPGPSTVHNHRVLQELVVPADYTSAVDREVSEMSLNYIRRYIQTISRRLIRPRPSLRLPRRPLVTYLGAPHLNAVDWMLLLSSLPFPRYIAPFPLPSLSARVLVPVRGDTWATTCSTSALSWVCLWCAELLCRRPRLCIHSCCSGRRWIKRRRGRRAFGRS